MKPGPKPRNHDVLFWSKVSVRGPDECWEWIGSRAPKGYGLCRWRGQKQAHRAAYILSNATDIPAGYLVLHSCDNPPCCNPRHLWLGTAKDNTADMVSKGRNYIPERRTHCPQGHEYSEQNTLWVWQQNRTYLAKRCKACYYEKYQAYYWRTRQTRLEKMRLRRQSQAVKGL